MHWFFCWTVQCWNSCRIFHICRRTLCTSIKYALGIWTVWWVIGQHADTAAGEKVSPILLITLWQPHQMFTSSHSRSQITFKAGDYSCTTFYVVLKGTFCFENYISQKQQATNQEEKATQLLYLQVSSLWLCLLVHCLNHQLLQETYTCVH